MDSAKPVQQSEWEAIYSSDSFRSKNLYPSEEIIAFVMRQYGDVPERSQIRILDIGCGWGNNLAFLKEQGFSYSGIDFSKTAVEHCQQSHGNVVCGDFTRMPFPAAQFDLAFDRMAIQHNRLPEITAIFSEVRRVLKPDGLFYSALIESGRFEVLTTYLNEGEIRRLAKDFSQVTVDYRVQTWNNQKETMKTNILIAKK